MVHNLFINCLKNHIYILSEENFHNSNTQRKLLRFTAKHTLLTPKLIVVNDKPYGFKKEAKNIRHLDSFPIFWYIDLMAAFNFWINFWLSSGLPMLTRIA